MRERLQSRMFWVGALVGLATGLVIGWYVWPVQFKNAYPVDLAPEYRSAYILLAAREFQRTGDAEVLSQKWLDTFPREVLPQLFQEAMATYSDRSEYVNALEYTLRFIREHSEEPLPPPGEAAVALAQQDIQDTLWPLVLAAGIVLGAVIFLYGVFQAYRWLVGLRPAYEPLQPVEPVAVEPVVWEEAAAEAPGEEAPTPPSPPPEEVPPPPPVAEPETPRPPLRVIASALEIRPLSTFQVVYTLSEEGYDEAFTVRDPYGENLGECGMGVYEDLNDQPGHPIAMEVWLFDKRDPITQSAYVLSDWAYAQPAVRARYEQLGKVVRARSGAVISLDTRSLRLESEIKDVAYAQLGEGNEVFGKLAVEMKVSQKVTPQ